MFTMFTSTLTTTNLVLSTIGDIIIILLPVVLTVVLGFFLKTVKDEGQEDKLKKAVEIVDNYIIPILLALYRSTATQPLKQDVAKWFKENVTQYLDLSDEEISALWKISVVTIEDTFKSYGYELNLNPDYSFATDETETKVTTKLLFK